MAMLPERSSSREPLHNFALPSHLKWGNQRFLRCMKLNSAAADHSSSSSETEPFRAGKNEMIVKPRSSNDQNPPLQAIGNDSDEIQAVRQRPTTLDLRDATEKMNITILDKKRKEKEKLKELDEPNSSRPWNLRTRRAACKAPQTNVSGGGKGGNCNTSSPVRWPDTPMAKSSRLRGGFASPAAKQNAEKSSERSKFSINLSKEEIESDFMTMLGIKPNRRPKKRPKAVQRQLGTLFPGLWLREISAEIYNIPDSEKALK